MQPPSALPAKVAPAAAASVSPSPQIRVRTTEPRSPTRASTAWVTFTGTAMRRLVDDLADQRDHRQQDLLRFEHVPGVVDDGGELAVGIDHEPEVAARKRARARRPAATFAVWISTNSDADAVLANGFTASTSAPSDVSRLGITIDTAPNE